MKRYWPSTQFSSSPARVDEPEKVVSADDSTQIAWGLDAIGLTKNPFHSGKGVTVAVLDTGIDKDYKTHPAFRNHNIEPKNFSSENVSDWQDNDGHGTHCAGTIFGHPVNGTKIGVATGVEKVLIGKVRITGGFD